MKSRYYLILLSALCTSLNMSAQKNKTEISFTGGYALQLVPAGSGWHGGINVYSKTEKRLKLDLQFSANLTREKNSYRSHFAANLIGGTRYYILDPTKTATIFTNVLVGPAFVIENGDDYIESLLNIGYSVGIFVDNNRFLTGLSIESYQSLLFKVGYAF
ncbi:MAG: hypothetical protein AB8F78_09310 [Saprospiraceae bacterium]